MAYPAPSGDRAVAGLVAGNLLALVCALLFEWGLVHLLWPFWIQSVIIGRYACRRIMVAADADAGSGGPRVRGPLGRPATGRLMAAFFALHYGFFHLIYAFFLLAFTLMASPEGVIDVRNASTGETIAVRVGRVGALDWLVFAGIGWTFWRAHRASHRAHVGADLAGRPGLGVLMMIPYARVLPMHLTILFGMWLGGGPAAVALFVLLKTAADLVMHRFEHRLLRQAGAAATPP